MNYIFSYNVQFNDQFKSTNYVDAFCESLRRINFKDKLVIFTESEQRLKSTFRDLNVEFVQVNQITERFQKDPNYPLIPGLEDLFIQRVLVKKRYIQENNINDDDNILCIDSRDSIFQLNPFEYMTSQKLTFGSEYIPYINGWTTPQFEMYKFDQSLYTSIMNYKGNAINCGVYIGSVKNFLKLTDDFIKDILYIKQNLSSVQTTIPVCDQIIINKLLVIDKLDYCEVLPHQNNLIMNYLLDGTFTYDGTTVYNSGKPISIIHQYDRNPTMFRLLFAQYSI